MGKPKQTVDVICNVRFQRPMVKKLQELAAKNERTFSAEVRMAAAAWVEREAVEREGTAA